MILYEKLYEREGNDSWLKDLVQIDHNPLELSLKHQQRWNGWAGEINEDNCITLDIDDLEKSQKIVDKFIDDKSLYTKFPSGHEEGVQINLKELIENHGR